MLNRVKLEAWLKVLCDSNDNKLMDDLKITSADEKSTLVAFAKLQGIDSIVFQKLKEKKLALFSDFEMDALRHSQLKIAVCNMSRFEQLDGILKLLGDHNIPVILLKGAYIAREVYCNLGMRNLGDFDLLLRKDDLLLVEKLLLSIGFIPEYTHRVISVDNHHFAFKKEQHIRLEIHWTLHQSHGMKIDIEGLWLRSRCLEHLPGIAYALCPEDMLLHLCLHMALHAYQPSLRMLYDIALMLEEFSSVLDFQALCQRAKAWGVANSVYVGFYLARELLCAKVPDACLKELCPEGEIEAYISIMRDQLLSFPEESRNIITSRAPLLLARSSWIQKMKLLRSVLFLPRKTMSLFCSAPADSWKIYLYYPLRWWDILLRYSVMFFDYIRGKRATRNEVEKSKTISALQHWMLSSRVEIHEK